MIKVEYFCLCLYQRISDNLFQLEWVDYAIPMEWSEADACGPLQHYVLTYTSQLKMSVGFFELSKLVLILFNDLQKYVEQVFYGNIYIYIHIHIYI